MKHFCTAKTVANQETVRSFSDPAPSNYIAQSAGAVEYTDCASAEG